MPRLLSIVSAVALACFLAGTVALARLDRVAPPHLDIVLPGGVPATFSLPGEDDARAAFTRPRGEDERPPAVVVMHGFAGDRVTMRGLARRLAASGYAVLNIDAMGHGQNRNPYQPDRASGDAFFPDLAAAVDYLRVHPAVDGTRIAVLGHSMGAGAALDYASRDSAIDACVMLSGGWTMAGPFPPANALFAYADGDPARIRERSRALASRLAGAVVEPDRTYGRPKRRDAVRVVEVAGANHVSIVWSEQTVRETVAWLDAAFGIVRAPGPTPSDPRAPLFAGLALAFVLVLPGLGQATGRLVPRRERPSAEGRWQGLALVAAALVLVMPLLATGTPAVLVPLEVGDAITGLLALAGLLLLAFLQLRRPALLAGLLARPLPTLWGAGLALVAIFVLMQPLGAGLHRLTLTPERTVAWALMTLGILPFALAFNLLLRRGPTVGAALAALCGRAVLLLVMVAGIGLGVLPSVLGFILPSLVAVALAFEILAAAAYAASGNVLAVAIIDAAWLALVTAAIMPIRI